ncbi:MAG TPA: alpha/beta hydrolase [Acidimicrobiia bacterium]|nr:alpha/beta hydrolase [Acidimicrobiia bacterium]
MTTHAETTDEHAGYHVFPKDATFTGSDGTPLAYTERGTERGAAPGVEGSGLTFVTVNGWSCSDVYWARLVPHLAEQGHRVVIMDTRGHGASGLPRPPGYRARNITADDMSLERVSRDFVELCDAAGIERAVFVGHSMGVQVIYEIYRRAPERFAGIVAVAGPYENPLKTFYGRSEAHMLFPVGHFALQAIPRFLLPAWRMLGKQYKLGYRAALLVRAAGPRLAERALAPYIEHFVSRDPLVMFKFIESMRASSAADVLPTVDVPVLILAGDRDPFTPLSVQRRMHELVPGSELTVYEGGHHTLPLEFADEINAALDDFLARRLTPPASRV